MAVEGKKMLDVVVAGTDLRAQRYKVVTISGTIAGENDVAYGVVDIGVNSGQHESVAVFGHMKGYAGAAISKGAKLSVNSTGYLITLAVSGSSPVGRARVAANSGDLFDFMGNFLNATTDAGV